MSEVPKEEKEEHVIHLTLKTEELGRAKEAIEGLILFTGDLFEVLNIRTIKNHEITEVVETEPVDDFSEYIECILEIRERALEGSRNRKHIQYLFESQLPTATEEVLIELLERGHDFIQSDQFRPILELYQIIDSILKFRKGVTNGVLLALIDKINKSKQQQRGNLFGAQYVDKIITHGLADTEILWALVKSPILRLVDKAIPLANEDMLKWIEENQQCGKLRQKAIEKRRRELS